MNQGVKKKQMEKEQTNKKSYKYKIVPLFFCILSLCNCNKRQFSNDLIKIRVTTSILNCEEANIHLKVIGLQNIRLIGKSILPICDENLDCEKSFYNLQDTTSIFLIEGYLSKKAHNIFDYGCTDSKIFKILNFTHLSSSF